jgi:lycopene cyclase domain-containing protein
MTYWLINAAFLTVVAGLVIAAIAARRAPRWAAVGLAGALILVMTAVFDNVMISVGLVAYAPEHISGALIGVAPLEDFAYAIAAVVGLPCLWSLLDRRARTVDAAEPDVPEKSR